MKTALLLTSLMAFLLLSVDTRAQAPPAALQKKVKFTYDAAGNRIKREVITILPGKGNTDVALKTANNTIEEQPNSEKTYIDSVGEVQMKLYPNPVKEQLVVEIENAGQGVKSILHLYDITGKLLHREENLAQINSVSFSQYPQGTYMIKITIADSNKEWMIIKQ